MSRTRRLIGLRSEDVRVCAQKRRGLVTWLGALSFEERCKASLERLAAANVTVNEVILLEYNTRVVSQVLEKKRREENYSAICDLATAISSKPIRRIEVSPYAYDEMTAAVQPLQETGRAATVIVDITCLTKIHAISLAASLGEPTWEVNTIIGYSSPQNYGRLERAQGKFGWKDVLVAPLGDIPSQGNEAGSRGIVVPGHEGDRLAMAINEVEPTGGVILIAKNDRRPDMQATSERKNRTVLANLMGLKASTWSRAIISIDRLDEVTDAIDAQAREALRQRAPVYLYPFGPKAMVFAGAFHLGVTYRDISWLVYPIPTGYDVGYTEGSGGTKWLTMVPATIPQGRRTVPRC